MTARRHHYIPQCYLKGFAVSRKRGKAQVYVFDREQRKMFVTATDNVGLERDFNRIETEGQKPDALENKLSGFESALTTALERTNAAGTFQSDEDRATILNFIGLVALRNPRRREGIRDFHEQIMKRMMDVALATKERWEGQVRQMKKAGVFKADEVISYEQLKAFHDAGDYKIALNTEYQILMEMKGFDAVLPTLFKRGWMFMRAPTDSGGFVTSDDPVNLMWSDPDERGKVHGPGFGLPGTQIIFPISTKLAVAGAFELKSETREVSEDMVAGFNGGIATMAIRQMYARDLHFRYKVEAKGEARKASRLIDDPHFRRSDDD